MPGNRTLWLALALGGLVLGCQGKPATQDAGVRPATAAEAPVAGEGSPSPNNDPSASASPLTRVTDRGLVCMVNNQFMGRPQIPIEVEGRTYFGCCEMCQGRLANEPTSRLARDPVSGGTVDKATAVIGKTSDGAVLYFENEQTFAAYGAGAVR